jgi:hypothetical protein
MTNDIGEQRDQEEIARAFWEGINRARREHCHRLRIKHRVDELSDAAVDAELAFRVLASERVAKRVRAALKYEGGPRDTLAILMELEALGVFSR